MEIERNRDQERAKIGQKRGLPRFEEAPSIKGNKAKKNSERYGCATRLHGHAPEAGTTRSRQPKSTAVPGRTSTRAPVRGGTGSRASCLKELLFWTLGGSLWQHFREIIKV